MSSSDFVKSLIGNVEIKSASKTTYLSKNEDWKFSLARIMLTGILKNQYYKSANIAAKEAVPLMVAAAKKDPRYLLKAAIFARQANMKGMVKLAVAALSGNANDKFLTDNRRSIISLLATFHPGQLIQFVELMKSKVLNKGFGARPQKWVQEVMQSWSEDKVEEFTLKYPSDFKHLLRLAHPHFSVKKGNLVKYLLDSSKTNKANGKAFGKKQKAVELMKVLKDDDKIAEIMLDNDIPWDVVKGFHDISGNVGLAMMTQMGLSALLLNIRSLEQNGIFNLNGGLQAFEMKMNEVQNNRSIPIDFAKPYIYCNNDKVKSVLVNSIVQTLENSMPEIEGRNIGVSVDISGSMSGEPLQTAGLLAIPFLKAKNLWFTTFDTGLYEEGSSETSRTHWYAAKTKNLCPVLKGKTRSDQVKSLLNLEVNGGTDVAISLRQAIKTNRNLDLHILITDEQQNAGTPLMTQWKEYKKKVNSEAELWVINATNNEWHAADFGDPSVTVYQTMTPAIFKNLQFVGQDLVSAIENVSL